jgi:acyl-CoA dehydrogenase
MTSSAVAEAVAAILKDHLTPDARASAGDGGWVPGLWPALAGNGFTTIGLAESAGGSGGDLTDVCDLLMMAGAAAVPLPLVESTLVGGWALTAAGIPLPDGPVTAAAGGLRVSAGTVTGALEYVPWAAQADLIVSVADGCVVALRPDQVRIEAAHNLAGERLDRVLAGRVTDAIVVPAPPGVTTDALRCRGAFGYAAMMAGAMSSAREMSVRYAMQREQFGRPISRFQAVGALLVRIAEEAAVAHTAVRAGLEADGITPVSAATAKIVAGEAAVTVAAAAHQVHGAIGMTSEYELGLRTRRLWAWQDTYGAQTEWSRRLGRLVAEGGADGLWPTIAGGSR